MQRQFSTRVAGIYQNRGHVGGLEPGQVLPLVRQPNNVHDTYAVAVYTQDSIHLGFIPRELAAALAAEMDSGLTAYATIQSTRDGYTPPRTYRRRRRKKSQTDGFSPPECFVVVTVGDGRVVSRQPRPMVTPSTITLPNPAPFLQPRPKNQSSNCFVATAVFQNPDHPTVQTLRQWRDTRLVATGVGKLSIRAYQIIGPIFAVIVDNLPILRKILVPILSRLAKRLVIPASP